MVALAAAALAQRPALFDYDRRVPFQYQEEAIRKDAQVEVAGAGFQSPKGGKVNLVTVRPTGKGPFAGVIFQHGGGQSMTTYVAEAEVLARAGAVSLILETPGTAPGKWKSEQEMSGAEMRDYYAEIVICYRRAIDYLESLPTVDRHRIAFVGHSYGAIMGGVLVGTDPRVKTFVLAGGVARYTRHIAEAPVDFWAAWRKQFTPEQMGRELEAMRPVDPDQYVNAAEHGPILVQCGNFDFINVEGCGALYQAASNPKELRWYDTDHSFADIEATFDRLQWLERELHLKPVRPLLERLWASPAKRSAPLAIKP
jgi:dipeptidyl aminopeptidase/acylaminoacyl peptidase